MAALRRQTGTATVARENTFDGTTMAPTIITDDSTPDGTTRPTQSAISTGLVIQLLVLIAILFTITACLIRRKRRRTRKAKEQTQNAFMIRQISAPNGLSGSTLPSYSEAHKPSSFPLSKADLYRTHSRQQSDASVMDDCMQAVYDSERALATTAPAHHHPYSPTTPSATSHTALMEPTTPHDVARGDTRGSVSRWLRNQRWIPSSLSGPLSSNPHDNHLPSTTPPTPTTAALPVPPTPTYSGVVAPTASAPQTPWSASHVGSHLAPPSPYAEPMLSGRSNASWASGDDRLSIRASIPASVLYPSPLQPAPPPRRLASRGAGSGSRDSSGSVSSLRLYGAETWKTMTPHEDPPHYEPRRGDPERVSPV